MTPKSRLSSSVIFPQVLYCSLLVIGLDQLTKFLARAFLSEAGSLPVLKNIFHLTLWYNTGAAFGLLKGGTGFFAFVAILSIVAILLLLSQASGLKRMFSIDVADRWVRLALGCVLGGAAGNLIDRLRFGAVVDFLDFRIWPVFNLADSAITIGGLLLMFKMLKAQR
ncbi:MAG: signal peptidase II [Candidatus Omnitrophota bacterium]